MLQVPTSTPGGAAVGRARRRAWPPPAVVLRRRRVISAVPPTPDAAAAQRGPAAGRRARRQPRRRCPAPSCRPPTSGLPALPGSSAARRRSASPRWSPAPTRCGSGTPARTSSGSPCLGTLGESDVVRNGTDVWAWSSARTTPPPTTRCPPAHGDQARRASPRRSRRDDPAAGRRAALAAIDPTTTVTTDGTATVAGRAAYELVLAPKDPARWSARCGSPSTASSTSRSGCRSSPRARPTPAFEVGFTSVDFDDAGAADFALHPAAGRHGHRARRCRARAGARRRRRLAHGRRSRRRTVDGGRAPGGRQGLDHRARSPTVPRPTPAAAAGERSTQPTSGADCSMLGAAPRSAATWGSGHLLRDGAVLRGPDDRRRPDVAGRRRRRPQRPATPPHRLVPTRR